jgi:hypothetical protein
MVHAFCFRFVAAAHQALASAPAELAPTGCSDALEAMYVQLADAIVSDLSE